MSVKQELKESGMEILNNVKEKGHRVAFQEEYGVEDFNDVLVMYGYVYFIGQVLSVDMILYLTEVTFSENEEVKLIADAFDVQISNIFRLINEYNELNEYMNTVCTSEDRFKERIEIMKNCIIKFIRIIDLVLPVMKYIAVNDVELEAEDAIMTDIKEFRLAYQSLSEKGESNG